jgi:hypothetical protein
MDNAELVQAIEENPADLVRAIEENAAELLLAMGAAGGGRQRDDAGIRWTIGGSPIDYHNAIVAADLTAETADAVIAESLHELKSHNVPGSWHVGPSMRPADLGERLLAAGFTHGGSEPGMAVPLAELVGSAHTTGLRVDRVRTRGLGGDVGSGLRGRGQRGPLGR